MSESLLEARARLRAERRERLLLEIQVAKIEGDREKVRFLKELLKDLEREA